MRSLQHADLSVRTVVWGDVQGDIWSNVTLGVWYSGQRRILVPDVTRSYELVHAVYWSIVQE